MAVKTLVYTVKTSLCSSCFKAKMSIMKSESHNENEHMWHFPVAGLQQLMVKHIKQNSQYMNTVLQNMNKNWQLLLYENTKS